MKTPAAILRLAFTQFAGIECLEGGDEAVGEWIGHGLGHPRFSQTDCEDRSQLCIVTSSHQVISAAIQTVSKP